MSRAFRQPLDSSGFSLVEVTVAIGIFAFAAVGILGLLPAALKLRSDSAQETRAVMIAEEMFASVRAAPSLTNVVFRDGPGGTTERNRTVDILKNAKVTGFPSQTALPFWSFDEDPGSSWTNARGADPEIAKSKDNAIQTLARVFATPTGTDGLYQVTCEVRAPASLPLENSTPTKFVTYFYSP